MGDPQQGAWERQEKEGPGCAPPAGSWVGGCWWHTPGSRRGSHWRGQWDRWGGEEGRRQKLGVCKWSPVEHVAGFRARGRGRSGSGVR